MTHFSRDDIFESRRMKDDRRRVAYAGLSCDVLWVTMKELCARSGRNRKAINYDIARKKLRAEIRHGAGCRTLFHPDEVKRYVALHSKEQV